MLCSFRKRYTGPSATELRREGAHVSPARCAGRSIRRPSEDQHNYLVEHVVYVVSMAWFFGFFLSFTQSGHWGQNSDAGLHMRRGYRQMCCVNIHNISVHVIVACYYQSDREG